jgi:hypothetical protein
VALPTELLFELVVRMEKQHQQRFEHPIKVLILGLNDYGSECWDLKSLRACHLFQIRPEYSDCIFEQSLRLSYSV